MKQLPTPTHRYNVSLDENEKSRVQDRAVLRSASSFVHLGPRLGLHPITARRHGSGRELPAHGTRRRQMRDLGAVPSKHRASFCVESSRARSPRQPGGHPQGHPICCVWRPVVIYHIGHSPTMCLRLVPLPIAYSPSLRCLFVQVCCLYISMTEPPPSGTAGWSLMTLGCARSHGSRRSVS